MQKIAVGAKAPAFSLPNQSGQECSLRTYQGQWVVFFFYPKDNTPGCTKESIEFTQKLEAFRRIHCQVVGISPDDMACHQRFIQQHQLSVDLLSDTSQQMSQAYGVWQEKNNYGKKSMGIVRSTFAINPEGVIAHIWSNVRVDGHVQEVYDTIHKLQS